MSGLLNSLLKNVPYVGPAMMAKDLMTRENALAADEALSSLGSKVNNFMKAGTRGSGVPPMINTGLARMINPQAVQPNMNPSLVSFAPGEITANPQAPLDDYANYVPPTEITLPVVDEYTNAYGTAANDLPAPVKPSKAKAKAKPKSTKKRAKKAVSVKPKAKPVAKDIRVSDRSHPLMGINAGAYGADDEYGISY